MAKRKGKIKNSKAEESDITFGLTPIKKDKQRTKKWYKDRIGRWTGTKSKKLMSCGPGKAKLPWDNFDRLFSFGETAIKIIYQNAMERTVGTWVDEGSGTIPMRYGTIVEPLIDRASHKELSKIGIVKSIGFKTFPDRPECGSSSDKIIVDRRTNKTIASVEMKGCTKWDTHYERLNNYQSDNSIDFWQMANQVLSHNVNDCYYVIASPPHDIAKYVFHDGNIMDLYDDWIKECTVTIVKVTPTIEARAALLNRLSIAESILIAYMNRSGNEDVRTVIEQEINRFHQDPQLMLLPPKNRFFKHSKNKKCKTKKKRKKKK